MGGMGGQKAGTGGSRKRRRGGNGVDPRSQIASYALA